MVHTVFMSCSISQYAHTHTFTCTACTYTYAYMYTYIYICVCVCMHACIHACIFILIYIYGLFIFTCIFILIFIYTLSSINIRKPEYTLTQQNTLISTLPSKGLSRTSVHLLSNLAGFTFHCLGSRQGLSGCRDWLYGHRVQRWEVAPYTTP